MFIDTHAHLNFKAFETDIDKVIKKSVSSGVRKIINVGSNYQTSLKAVRMTENKYLYASVGLHPIHLIDNITEKCLIEGKEYKFATKKEKFDYKKYEKLIENTDKVVAVGETGLDFYRIEDKNKSKIRNTRLETNSKFKIQKQVFIEHVRLAKKYGLPLIMHCRSSEEKPYEAYNIMLKILLKEKYYKGVIHCFTGNLKQACDFINLGFLIGVNGIVTFSKSYKLQDIIKKIPLESIILETDCPYLSPEPYRGKRNTPEYVPVIAKKIANLKSVNIKDVEYTTSKNAYNLFEFINLI